MQDSKSISNPLGFKFWFHSILIFLNKQALSLIRPFYSLMYQDFSSSNAVYQYGLNMIIICIYFIHTWINPINFKNLMALHTIVHVKIRWIWICIWFLKMSIGMGIALANAPLPQICPYVACCEGMFFLIYEKYLLVFIIGTC